MTIWKINAGFNILENNQARKAEEKLFSILIWLTNAWHVQGGISVLLVPLAAHCAQKNHRMGQYYVDIRYIPSYNCH